MHPAFYAIAAIDLANERVRQAEARHRYRDALDHPNTPGATRRFAARAAAGLSRVSASVARRLDGQSGDGERLRGRSTPA
jgi:hypothetical protein